jgi:hypothetical protein
MSSLWCAVKLQWIVKKDLTQAKKDKKKKKKDEGGRVGFLICVNDEKEGEKKSKS